MADSEAGGALQTAKDLFAGAAGGVAQVLIGMFIPIAPWPGCVEWGWPIAARGRSETGLRGRTLIHLREASEGGRRSGLVEESPNIKCRVATSWMNAEGRVCVSPSLKEEASGTGEVSGVVERHRTAAGYSHNFSKFKLHLRYLLTHQPSMYNQDLTRISSRPALRHRQGPSAD